MAGKDIIMMSQRELRRLQIIHKALDKKLKQVGAADILGLSNRQIRRIVEKVRREGDKGIVHKSRGRPSNRTISGKIKARVINLYRQKYPDFGPTLANEKLFEIDKIKIGTQTLRNWLIEEGEWKKSRKHRKHLRWRERKHHFGEMEQVDGSHHDWFEGRGPKCVLMGHIDDAKSNVFAQFCKYEGTFPFMDSFKRYAKRYGLPHSVYIDKHSTYKSTAKPSIEDELNNREPLTQVGRALNELGVKLIHAHSPQAKGRIERLFRTFQDRLIKEMRLRNIKSIKEANNFLKYYLPIYNKRFSVEPLEKGDLHRPLPKNINLDSILCLKTERALRNDSTIVHNKKLYQIIDHVNAKKLTVEERINGSLLITHMGNHLKYQEITQRPLKQEPNKPYLSKPRKTWTPPLEHPWKRPTYEKRLREELARKEEEQELVEV